MTKRLLVVAGALLLIAAALPRTADAQTPPPHKDPQTEEGEFNAISLLEYSGVIVGLLAQGDYSHARDLPKQLRHANIPEDIRFIIDRYGESLANLRNELEFTESSLRRASVSLNRGDYPATRRQLEASDASLKKTNRLLESLRVITGTVARRLGVFDVPAGTPLRKAYEQLQALSTRLNDLGARHATTLSQLKAAVATSAGNATPRSAPVYQTQLSFESPSPAYPGQVIHITGQVTAVDGPDPVVVFLRVFLGQDLVASFATTATFQQNIKIPANALLGQHVLTVVRLPQGPYVEASASKHLELAPASSHLTVHSPRLSFLPRGVPVSGEVTSALGPLKNAKVTLKLGEDQTQLQTDNQGQFSGRVKLSSLSNLFLGPQTLYVGVQPAEPIYGTSAQRVTLFIINVTNLAILLVGAICIPSALIIAWRKQHDNRIFAVNNRQTPQIPSVRGALVFPASPPAESWPYIDPGSPRGRVVSAYHSTARFLELSLEITFLPYFTLHDFLIAIGSQASTALIDLTGLAERALYAAQPVDEKEAQRAEGLAKAVQEEVG
jgi:hypothetical protein